MRFLPHLVRALVTLADERIIPLAPPTPYGRAAGVVAGGKFG